MSRIVLSRRLLRSVVWFQAKRSHLLILFPLSLYLFISLTIFPSSGRDDSYITYWPAHTLSEFGEIVNYSGERVEQSSSLFHVVVLAILAKLTGVDMPTIGGVVSILSGIAAIVYTYGLLIQFLPKTLAIMASTAVGISPYFAYWATAGLEAPLAAAIFVATAYHYMGYLGQTESARPSPVLWLITAMFLAVRPESIVVLGTSLIALLLLLVIRRFHLKINQDSDQYRSVLRRILGLALVVILTATAISIFRLLYFGALFPQPVTAKTTGISIMKLSSGWAYLHETITEPHMLIVFLPALAGVFVLISQLARKDQTNMGKLLIALLASSYMAFIVTAGGDWMEGARFLVPIIPLLVILALIGLSSVAKKKFVLPIVFAMVILQLDGVWNLASFRSTTTPIWKIADTKTGFSTEGYSWFEKANRIHLREIPFINEMELLIKDLHDENDRPLVIMSGQAGMIAYHIMLEHYGNIEFLDPLSLTTDKFTKCQYTKNFPSTTFGRNIPTTYILENRVALETNCGIPNPDIIYGLPIERTATEYGYHIVYAQEGDIKAASRLSGAIVKADQYILVRDDLLQKLSSSYPKTMIWDSQGLREQSEKAN